METEAARPAALDRFADLLRVEGIEQAVLSSPSTLGHLVGYETEWEDWPIGDSFTAAPPLLVLKRGRPTLVVPTLYSAPATGCPCEVVISPTFKFRGPVPDPVAELERTFAALELEPIPTAVEPRSLPLRVVDLLRATGAEPVSAEELLVRARRRKLPAELSAIRHACAIADRIQAQVKEVAAAGLTEAQLAGLVLSDVYRVEGRRVPAILTINAGANSATPTSPPEERVIQPSDIILTDTSPWVDGAWSDTANAVVVGKPTREHRRIFDSVRRALELAISLCRPGERASEIDRRVRESLAAEWGEECYGHHTGHGIGAAWSEPPLIIPGRDELIEEGMVLAVEPAVYRPGWGGMRLEHVFLVGPQDNEILSKFEHTL
ncbi:MAG: M24 family metallopeptidase [Solirubrobacterales bacterium]